MEKSKNYQYIKSIRKRRKSDLLNILGKSCHRCGYAECDHALEFHHCNPDKKSFNIGASMNKSIAKQLTELSKCWLLCANCHVEIDHMNLDSDYIYSDESALREFFDQTGAKEKALALALSVVRGDNFQFVWDGVIVEVDKSEFSKYTQCSFTDCSNKIVKGGASGLCWTCYAANIPTKIEWPCTCEILKMLEAAPFTSVGRSLGVSNTSVRKRIKSHPDCVCEIKNRG